MIKCIFFIKDFLKYKRSFLINTRVYFLKNIFMSIDNSKSMFMSDFV